jgi:hypothetical protein
MLMNYDFAPAIAIANRQLAPYFAYREALAAGAKVSTFEEGLRWKEQNDKTSDTKKTAPKRRIAAMTAANKRKK